MSDLDEALAQIAAIRSQMARNIEFRGYGPPTIAITGGLAILAALVQPSLVGAPLGHIGAYLALWLGAAAVALVAVAIEMVTRSRRIHSTLAPEMLAMVAEHFLPALVTGALLTIVLAEYAPAALWMLPGLWQICFAFGLFVSYRFMPPGAFSIAIWYLAWGLSALALAQGGQALAPWVMGLPFGLGQLCFAGLLQARLRDAP